MCHVGAGPTGLSATYYLDEETLLLDKNSVHDKNLPTPRSRHIHFIFRGNALAIVKAMTSDLRAVATNPDNGQFDPYPDGGSSSKTSRREVRPERHRRPERAIIAVAYPGRYQRKRCGYGKRLSRSAFLMVLRQRAFHCSNLPCR